MSKQMTIRPPQSRRKESKRQQKLSTLRAPAKDCAARFCGKRRHNGAKCAATLAALHGMRSLCRRKYSPLYFVPKFSGLCEAFNQEITGGKKYKLHSLSHEKVSQDGHCARRTGERARRKLSSKQSADRQKAHERQLSHCQTTAQLYAVHQR